MCSACKRFPQGAWRFTEVAESIERHGVLYRCGTCEGLFEVIAEERSVRFPSAAEIRRFYPSVFGGND